MSINPVPDWAEKFSYFHHSNPKSGSRSDKLFSKVILRPLIDKLYKEGAEDISVVENFAELENMNDIDDIDQTEDTMTILSKYVNSMKIDNKQELDTLMKSLYTEALSVETI